jgi:hypothetical protein
LRTRSTCSLPLRGDLCSRCTGGVFEEVFEEVFEPFGCVIVPGAGGQLGQPPVGEF